MAIDITWWCAWFCALCVVIGFFNPSIMLWWEDTQYRMKVLKVYGVGFVIFLVMWLVVGLS